MDVITSENRRLQKEVAVLRERVAALEGSRWWRLHPRSLALRMAAGLGIVRPRTKERVYETVLEAGGEPDDSLVARFRNDVVAHGSFTEEWFIEKIPMLEPILQELEGRATTVLEIGSYEGLSSCFLLWRLPDAELTCIDTFEGSPENVAYGETVAGLEERFDGNVAFVDASRVRKLRGDSRGVLLDLAREPTRFDLVFVDGSHLALDVLVDASLTWPLVARGGVVIFDDYVWTTLGEDPLMRPGPAIDSFLRLVEDHSEVLHRHEQVVIRKTD